MLYNPYAKKKGEKRPRPPHWSQSPARSVVSRNVPISNQAGSQNPYANATRHSSPIARATSSTPLPSNKPVEANCGPQSPSLHKFQIGDNKLSSTTSMVSASNHPTNPYASKSNKDTVADVKKNRSSPTRNSTFASIRPPSWNSNSNPQIETTKDISMEQKVELPGEESLPKEIQYTKDHIRPIKDQYRQLLVNNAKLTQPLLNGWKLFSHQKRAILQGLMKRRMILALDMGLGKTLIGCVWSRSFKLSFKHLKIFVICPVSLKEEWKRTAENATGLKVEEGKDATVMDSLDMRICGWSKVPTMVDSSAQHFVVVFDEAHSMQSMQAARTKDALKLVSNQRCVGVLLLTGTPMKNGKPSNLFPLLKAVRHPLGKHQKAYEKHFCAGEEKNFGRGRPVWVANGCSNLNQLKRLVKSNLLHLTKEQCLAELPPLTRETRNVPISSRHQIQYTRGVKELANIHANVANFQDEAILGAFQRLRVTCSFAKVGATVELARNILVDEPALVIFTNFAQVAKSVYNQLNDSGWNGELLTGETPQKKRQGMVDRFQEGLSPVFVCTFGAGGVGLTLTAACTVILIDRPWTPGEMRQAEDRVRRIGQTKNVKSIWMSAFDLDAQIDAMLESKKKASNAVLAKDGFSTGMSAKISIPKLLASLLSKCSGKI